MLDQSLHTGNQRRGQAVGLVVWLLAFAGCPRVPINFGRDGEARTAAELLKRVDLNESTVVAVKGEARLVIETPRGKGSVGAFIAVATGSRIHLEQLDFFGRPQLVWTTDGTRFGLYDAPNGQFVQGPATPANLARLVPLVMSPEELSSVLLGKAPRLEATSPELNVDDAKGTYLVTLKRGGAQQRLTIRPPLERVEASSRSGSGAYDLEFGDVGTWGAVTFPRHVTLTAAAAHTRVELTWKDLALNEPPEESLFEVSAPEGIPVVDVDAEGHLVGP